MDRRNWDAAFAARFERHEDELKWLYFELYHGDAEAYDYFLGMLERMYQARPAALKKLDRVREENVDWYKGHDLTGMLLYVSAFAGDLKGVRKKLDYIQECGVNYLHLMPLLESPDRVLRRSAFERYYGRLDEYKNRPMDCYWMDPRDGTMSYFATVCGEEKRMFSPVARKETANDWVLVLKAFTSPDLRCAAAVSTANPCVPPDGIRKC